MTYTKWAIVGLGLVVAACGGSGTTDPNSTPARLSAAGESCSRTADCSGTLVCISSYCTTGPMASTDAGEPVTPPGPRFSARGEGCLVTADCGADLICRPLSPATFVCDYAQFPFQPSGKECTGECNTTADCCQLPVGYMGFGSCEHLANTILTALGGTTVSAACVNPGAQDRNCFAYASYCNCAASTWTCTNNQCLFTAACQFSGVVSKGCTDLTRTGNPLVTTCDNGRCQTPTAMAQCTTPASCDTKAIVDRPGQICHTGECTCISNACYRRCTKEIDCEQGFSCDMTTSVCMPAGACQTDEYCAQTLKRVNAACRNKQCVTLCDNSYDCNGSGLGGTSFEDMVCNAQHVCEDLGCSSDAECVATSGVKKFCVTKPTTMGAARPRSAITDGR